MTRREIFKSRCKNLGQSSYKPLVSYVKERQASMLLGPQRTLTPIEDSEEQEEEAVVTSREQFQVPTNDDVKRLLQEHQEYLDDRGIEKHFLSLCKELLSLPRLPYNPYPAFVRKTSGLAEGFHLPQKTSHGVESLMFSTKTTRIPNIVTNSNDSSVFGLSGILSMVNPQVGQYYKWLIQSLTPPKKTLKVDNDAKYTNYAIPLLLGSSVYYGSIYPHPLDVVIRVEYIITGIDIEQGLELYAESLFQDVSYMQSETPHTILGTSLPAEPNSSQHKDWKWEGISADKSTFKNVVIHETKNNGTIDFMCVFSLNEHKEVFILGRKQFTMNFMKVNRESGQEEHIIPFVAHPMVALHKGIFLQFDHADHLIGAFSASVRRHQPAESTSWSKALHQGVISSDPSSEDIISPIRQELQKSIVGLHPQSALFEALPLMIVLCTLDRKSRNDALLVDLHKMAHSTASYLQRLLMDIEMIEHLLKSFNEVSASKPLAFAIRQYRHSCSEVFNKMYQERSIAFSESGRIILQRVDKLAEVVEQADSTLPEMVGPLLLELQCLKGYIAGIQLQLVEDVYTNCPEVKNELTRLTEAFPSAVPQSKTPTRQVPGAKERKSKNKKKVLRHGHGNESFTHGVEHRVTKGAIDVETNTSKETAPKSMAKESVLLKYIIDTRLDSIWPEFLIELLTGEHRPSNPYPRLVSILRLSAQRMDLFQESSEKRCKNLLHGAARMKDEGSSTYYLPGADAHGCVSSLALVDSTVFFQLLTLCQPFITLNYVQKKGPYRLALCTGLGGHTPLYGRMAPYIIEVHLEEYCFIRGPDEGTDEGLAMYAKLVKENITVLQNESQHIVIGLYAGHTVIQAEDIERHWREHQDVFLKIYTKIDWRYVAVVKHFKPHYIDLEETSIHEFFPKDPAAYYQVVFFEGDKAAFYHRYAKPKSDGDPFSAANIQTACQAVNEKVAEASRQHDWINVHRWLLTRNLISKGKSHLSEVWCMLHGVGAQFEYLLNLVNSMTEIMKFALSLPEQSEGNKGYFLGSVDLKFLGRMVLAFRQKAIEVGGKQEALAASCLQDVIVNKLHLITERLSDTGEILLVPSPKTVHVLQHLAGMMEAQRDSLAYDLHMVSPEALAMVKAIVDDTPSLNST